jgi:glycosyltransferase involved in cell wall biosynthesis
MKKITAIITTHNRAAMLASAIKSVLNQTFKDFELLIVDDASEDKTEEVVKTFVDNKIRYIKISTEDSKGGNYARNIGIKEAKAEFVAFLDDDDEWLPEKLEKQLDIFKKNEKIGLVHAGLFYVSADNKILGECIFSGRGDLSKEILVSNIIIGPTSTMMIRKKDLEKAGLFDIKMPAHQDYDICIRLCQVCEVDFVKEPLVKLYNRQSSVKVSHSLENYEKAIFLMGEKYQDLILTLDKKSIKQRNFNIYYNLSSVAFNSGNYKELKNYYIKALRVKFNLKMFVKLCFTFVGIYDLARVRRYFCFVGVKGFKEGNI